MPAKINWFKIGANTGYTFFLMLAGMLTADKLMNTERPVIEYIAVCLVVAFINAMVVFFAQLLQSVNSKPKQRRKSETKSKITQEQKDESKPEVIDELEETDEPEDTEKGREKFVISNIIFLF
jgi:hypothetical protein